MELCRPAPRRRTVALLCVLTSLAALRAAVLHGGALRAASRFLGKTLSSYGGRIEGSKPAVDKTEVFKYALTPENKELLFWMLDLVHNFTVKENLTYFLSDGSVLGSYRHHDIIPWDDDIDILLPASQRVVFQTHFYKMDNPRLYRRSMHFLAKISSPLGPYRHGYNKYTSPYLDLFFYDETDDVIDHRKHPTMAKSDIFPLQLRPFNGRMYYFPRDPRRYLQVRGLDPDLCDTGGFSHLTEKWKPPEEIANMSCAGLSDRFPFVKHTKEPEVCREELMVGGAVTATYTRPNTDIPLC